MKTTTKKDVKSNTLVNLATDIKANKAIGDLFKSETKHETPTAKAINGLINEHVTPAAQVLKDLINEKLNKMTFLELALTLAHVMGKK